MHRYRFARRGERHVVPRAPQNRAFAQDFGDRATGCPGIGGQAIDLQKAPVGDRQAPLGIEQVTAGPAGFGREFSAEIDRVSKVVQTAGIKID